MNPMMMYNHRRSKREMLARGEERVHVERPPRKKVNLPHTVADPQYEPLSAFMILLTPEIFMIFLFASLLYMQFYSNL